MGSDLVINKDGPIFGHRADGNFPVGGVGQLAWCDNVQLSP